MFLEGGVVDQYVDVREPFQHLVDGLLAKALLAHVAGNQQAALAFRFHIALRFVGVRMFVQVNDDDIGPFARIQHGHGAADARIAARDDGDHAGQLAAAAVVGRQEAGFQ